MAFYWLFGVTVAQRTRISTIGKRAMASSFFFLRQTDLDDPDYRIKCDKLQEKHANNLLKVRWGGTNSQANYL